ncbi:hypothetical protein BC936DRAFT_149675 [Jimgerdemannia flammicorona]|uniref:Uncharacterized protein n=1 Tax=Jimgerdemannia flammicorona TaxID=994334 RepID=A0A433D0C5_9FUNG|nr:hypothetical protein BC936DRAFT_149675 [Jimgerdemannia flammicorona]
MDGQGFLMTRTPLLPSLRLKHGGIDPEEGERGGPRLGRDSTRERANDDRPSLCLPVGIDDCAMALADLFVIPLPRLRVDRLTDGSDDTQGGQIMALDPRVSKTTEGADGGGCGVELGDLVLRDDLPETGWVGRGGAERERAVDDVRVARDPSDVSHAGEDIVLVVVEHVLDRRRGTKEVPACGVDNALGFAR